MLRPVRLLRFLLSRRRFDNNIRVGRARDITGPYRDRDGTALLEGRGTLVRQSDARWRGPIHNSAFHDENGADWLIYHAYDAENGGASRLRVEKLGWDGDGWPFAAQVESE